MFSVPEKYRIKSGRVASDSSYGNNGAFRINSIKLSRPIFAIASDMLGWEHVSASLPNRCPTWFEMCLVKDLFWGVEDMVVQYHPPKSDYVNCHKYTLHLWRPAGVEGQHWCPMPPPEMVGPTDAD